MSRFSQGAAGLAPAPPRPAMSLQKRLLMYLLVGAPLVWAIALAISVDRAEHSVNELFDTELIRLSRQVQVLLPSAVGAPAAGQAAPGVTGTSGGEADLSDMAIAVWDAQGRLIVADREGGVLPYRPQGVGFVDDTLRGVAWRIYYLQSTSGQWLVAVGQKSYERQELVLGLVLTQLVPWLLVLPALLALMAWAVRRALAPVHAVARELGLRRSDDLKAVPTGSAPTEIRPLLEAMNNLFERVDQTLTRERRFTADAAHELRTPLAVLRAQWDVVRRSEGPQERAASGARLDAGLDRMDRLVTQMLALSRVESRTSIVSPQYPPTPVCWPEVVQETINDCLPVADRRHIDIGCEWPADPASALPLTADVPLLAVMLRNLLDNAVRYAEPGSMVGLHFTEGELVITNTGPALAPDDFARLGERFHRQQDQLEAGSGLGVSIARRIAALHGLALEFGPGPGGRGMRVVVGRSVAAGRETEATGAAPANAEGRPT